jgi:bifunctional DNase/RNase
MNKQRDSNRKRRLLEVSVARVAPFLRPEQPLVWLCEKETEGNPRLLPIAVGEFEAAAIQMPLGEDKSLRPISYDLLASMVRQLGVTVRRVVIHTVRRQVFLGSVLIERDGDLRDIDTRPSDGIAMALRLGIPVFVTEELLEESGLSTDEDHGDVDDAIARFSEMEPQTPDELAGAGSDSGEENVIVEALPLPETTASQIDEPVKSTHEATLIKLQERLQQAVMREQYEEAALLRDQIDRLTDETRT